MKTKSRRHASNPVATNRSRLGLTIIEGLGLGFIGADRLYMGFPKWAALKLILLAVSIPIFAYYGIWGLITFVPALILFLIDFFWVMATSIGASHMMPFFTKKGKMSPYWEGDNNSVNAVETSRGVAIAFFILLTSVVLYLIVYAPSHFSLPAPNELSLSVEEKALLKASDNGESSKVHLVSFAHNCCYEAHEKMAESALKAAVTHHKHDLESAKKVLPPHIIERIETVPFGAGWWSWKPHFIRHYMNTTEEGTIILYGDTSIRLLVRGDVIANEIRRRGGAMFFEVDNKILTLRSTIKSDVLLAAGLDPAQFRKKYGDKKCLLAAFAGFVNNAKNRLLVDQWIALMEDKALIEPVHSKGGAESPFLIFNGYDQSVLSALARIHYPGDNPAFMAYFTVLTKYIGIDNTQRNSHTLKYYTKYMSAMLQSQGQKVLYALQSFGNKAPQIPQRTQINFKAD